MPEHEPARGFEFIMCAAVLCFAVLLAIIMLTSDDTPLLMVLAPLAMIAISGGRIMGWIERGPGGGGSGGGGC